MKKFTLLAGSIFLGFGLFAQDFTFQKCATTNYMKYRDSIQPGYIEATQEAFDIAKASQEGVTQKSDEVYKIPVVVHIVYNTPAQNLDDAVIHNQIQILNEDYNRQNSDSSNLREEFLPYAGSANIEFVLAAIDPDGNPTNGITRTETSLTSFIENPIGILMGDMSEIERVKSTTNGGIDPWDQDRYMNIWVCNMEVFGMTAILGYATPPSGLPNWPPGATAGMSDGVVLQYQTVGSNNPTPIEGYTVLGRTAVHEVGHYLGLRHIFADNQGSCANDDGIDDTPKANNASDSDCNTSKNTCTDDIDGVDLLDMVENYMDYSAETCQNTFTKGQISLMRGVLENQRWDLVNDNDNLLVKEENLITISLYPNPSRNTATFQSNVPLDGNLVIVDLNGKIVKEITPTGLSTEINISNLEQGIYHVYTQGVTRAIKLVKI